MAANALKRFALAGTSCLFLAACQQFDHFRDQFISPAVEPLVPGRKIVMLPDDVWKRERCESRDLPYLRLDQSEVTPKTAKPGSEIFYRMFYTACVPQQPGYIFGRLQTSIYSDHRTLGRRSDEGFPVETGKWIVNTKISVPEKASPGIYYIDAEITANEKTIEDRASFNVEIGGAAYDEAVSRWEIRSRSSGLQQSHGAETAMSTPGDDNVIMQHDP